MVFLALGVAVVTELVPVLAVLVGAPDLHALLSSAAPIPAFIAVAGGPTASRLMSLGIALAIFNAMIAVALMAGRQLYSTGRDRFWPPATSRALGRVHPRLGSPWNATLAMGAAALAGCLLDQKLLVILLGNGNVALYAGLCIACIVGRRSGATAHAGYRMPLFPFPPLVALAALAAVVWFRPPRPRGSDRARCNGSGLGDRSDLLRHRFAQEPDVGSAQRLRTRECTMKILVRAAAGALAFLSVGSTWAQAQDRAQALLRELSQAAGPSGFEEDVRGIMVRELKPYAAKITYDGLGSVIAQHGSSGPRIMLDAHMDELGGVVRRTTREGYLSMQMLGGWLDQALPDQRWVIIGAKGPVLAVTGIRDIHYTPTEERSKVIPRDQILLDVGARTEAELVALGVGPGDPVVPDSSFAVLNGTRNYLGKAWDDRVGCAVVIEALRRLAASGHPNQLFVAATTQEEIGLRGAHTAADAIRPDIGIAIEGGVTGDSPGGHPEESQVRLGGGPGLFLYDSSALPNRKLVALTREAAARVKSPLQVDLAQGYGDDSAEIQKSNGGAPTVNLVVPVRYTHAHNGVMNRDDFDHLVDLVVALVQRLDAPTVARLRNFTPAP